MSNVFKKAFTVGVVATNILWSVGVAAFVPAVVQAATCPSFGSGDMVKVDGYSAIYAIDSNGKTLYFPTGDEFKSWNSDEKYSGYTAISQDCFNSTLLTQTPKTAPLGVNFRPGSYVLKSPSSAQLFVVEPGNKLAKITPAAASALYGANYKARTLSVVFYSNYDASGADVTENKVHPGMLVSNGGKTWYVDSSSMLREVTAAGFSANRFKQAFVRPVTAAQIAGLSVGAMIDSKDAAIADRTQTGGVNNGPVTPPSNNGSVSVSLAAETPAGLAIPQKANGVVFTKFVASSSNGATLNDVVVHRIGLGSNTDLSAVYIYDGSTRLTSGRTVSSDTNKVIFSNLKVNLSSGPKTLSVVGDLSATALSGAADGFEVVEANGVAVTGVAGNIMTVGATSVASSTVAEAGTGGSLRLGASGAEVARVQIDASAANHDLALKALTLTNAGSLSNSYLSNLQLSIGGKVVASAASMSNDKVIFNLVTPYAITKGDTKTFYVYADNTGGRVSDNIKFYVDQNTDVQLVDTQLNANVALTNNFASGDETYTLTGGDLTLANNGPATGNIGRNVSNVVLQKFSFSSSNAVTVKNIKVSINLEDASGNIISTSTNYGYVKNVKIVDLDNNNQTIIGPQADMSSGTFSSPGYYKVFNDTFDISVGQTRHLAVVADIDTNFPAGMKVYSAVDLSGANYVQYQDNSQYVSSSSIVPSTLTGNKLTVNAAALTVTRVTPPASASIVKGTTQDALGLLLTASTSDDVKVTSLKVRVYASTTAMTAISGLGDTAANTVVNTVSLREDGAQSALATKNLSDSSGTFSSNGSNYYYVTFSNLNYVVPAGASKKLVVSLGLKDSISGTRYVAADMVPSDDMDVETAADGKSVTENSNSHLNTTSPVVLTIGTGGTVSAAVDGSSPTSDIVLSGTDATAPVTMGVYRFKSTQESSTITGAALKVQGTAANIKKVTLTYKNAAGATVTKDGFLNAGVATFNDGTLDIRLVRDQDTLVTVGAVFNTVTEGATGGTTSSIYFEKNTSTLYGTSGNLSNNFVVLGDSGTKKFGQTDGISVNDANVGTFTVYKTKVVATESDSGSLTHGTRTQDPVGVFTFTSTAEAGSSQNSTLSTITLNLSGNLIAGAGNGDDTTLVSVYSGNTFDATHLMGSAAITGLASGTSNNVAITLTQQNEFSGTKTVYVVVNTTDSDFSDTTNVEKLTTQLVSYTWSDGSAAATPVTGIPVYSKTYSY